MSPERSKAYRRVMKTLDDMGPSKLFDDEQQRIRYAADNLIFSTDLNADVEACDALEDVAALCRALVESGRWEQSTADAPGGRRLRVRTGGRYRPPGRLALADNSRDRRRRLQVHGVTRVRDHGDPSIL